MLRANRIKKASNHQRFFLYSVFLSDTASSTAVSYATQRPGPNRPHDSINLHPCGTNGHHPLFHQPPGGVTTFDNTSPLSGEHSVLPRRPTERGKALSTSKAAPLARRPSNGGVPSLCQLCSCAPPYRPNTALGILEGILCQVGTALSHFFPPPSFSFLSILFPTS